MFSHSDLLSHKCEHCVEKYDAFHYSANNSSASEYQGLSQSGCWWYMLAKACFEWIDVRTQVRPISIELDRDGEFILHHEVEATQGEDTSAYFECLLKSSGTLLFITGNILNRTLQDRRQPSHDHTTQWRERICSHNREDFIQRDV